MRLGLGLGLASSIVGGGGGGALPVITYSSSLIASSNGATQTHAGSFAVDGAAESLLAIVGVTNVAGGYSSATVTAQPSGSIIAATLVQSAATSPRCHIYQAILPSGTTTITTEIVFASSPFNSCYFHVSTIPVANLSSTTKVGSGVQVTAASLSSTTALATTSGGAIFAIGVSLSTAGGNSGAFTGTETYTGRAGAIIAGTTYVVGDASNVGPNAASSATVTFGNSANTTIAAASWR